MRGSLNAPTQEESKRARDKLANTMLPTVRRISQCSPDDQVEEVMI